MAQLIVYSDDGESQQQFKILTKNHKKTILLVREAKYITNNYNIKSIIYNESKIEIITKNLEDMEIFYE
jgi:hypothetical protein